MTPQEFVDQMHSYVRTNGELIPPSLFMWRIIKLKLAQIGEPVVKEADVPWWYNAPRLTILDWAHYDEFGL